MIRGPADGVCEMSWRPGWPQDARTSTVVRTLDSRTVRYGTAPTESRFTPHRHTCASFVSSSSSSRGLRAEMMALMMMMMGKVSTIADCRYFCFRTLWEMRNLRFCTTVKFAYTLIYLFKFIYMLPSFSWWCRKISPIIFRLLFWHRCILRRSAERNLVIIIIIIVIIEMLSVFF